MVCFMVGISNIINKFNFNKKNKDIEWCVDDERQ